MENFEFLRIATSGKCIFCTSKASLTCHRCGDFYCSKKCQLSDWQRHRYICFAVPSLVNPLECSAFTALQELPQKSVGSYQGQLLENKIAISDSTPPNEIALKKEIADSSKSDRDNVDKVQNSAVAKSLSRSRSNSIASNISSTKLNHHNLPPLGSWPANGTTVCILSFVSANRCFVRATGEEADKAFADLRAKINMVGQQLPILNNMKHFQVAIAKYESRFERVKLIDPVSSKCPRLLYLDLGIVSELNGVELREINDELLNLPSVTFRFSLKDVHIVQMCKELQEFQNQFVGQRFIINFNKQSFINLTHINSKDSLNNQMRSFLTKLHTMKKESKRANVLGPLPKTPQPTNLKSEAESAAISDHPENSLVNTIDLKKIETEKQLFKEKENIKIPNCNSKILESIILNVKDKMKEPPQNISFNGTPTNKPTEAITRLEPVLNPPFPSHRISLNSPQGIDVFIVDSSNLSRGIIGAFDSAYARNFAELHARLADLKDPQPYSPMPNEYVIARYEKGWYRAKVMKINSESRPYKYNVMFIEFTNFSTVADVDIRRYPANLTEPCYTSVCLIQDFPHKLSAAQHKFLDEKFQLHSMLHIDTLTYLHDMAIINCKAMIEALNKLA